MRGYYPGYHTFGSFFGIGYGWIGMIVIGVIIFIVLYLLFKGSSRRNKDYYFSEMQEKKDKALEILNEKFVKGEIDEEEYLRKKKLIKD
ncbi:SHOCT domain-containing protein [Marinitoga aeolica]|uniref:SHOCT domain-containing protein n=1 Tax=Marinitoga aeolica TaxID=2809031 RepID=A0ABY8PQL2_9BACT|nr:SHOCT domain-containing protein [Marinitoga aeolica]WGS64933.1 SHOCT domain-containing protein [Marinitoga aeolica]